MGCRYWWEDYHVCISANNRKGRRGEAKTHPPTFNRNPPRPKPPLLRTQHAPIIRTHDRYNRRPRLHRQMKSPLFERPHLRPRSVTPRSLWKYENALSMLCHFPRRARKRLNRALIIASIYEHSAGQ